MRYDRVNKQQSAQLFTSETKTGEDACCTQAEITLIYQGHSFASVPNTAENIPEGKRCASCKLKCHLTKSKGQLRFEAVVPYQSAVVFAVLVGQVCNGGCNAGSEELLPLVKVALMDLI